MSPARYTCGATRDVDNPGCRPDAELRHLVEREIDVRLAGELAFHFDGEPRLISGAMISRLVRYWLEMLLGTRTGPRSLRVPMTVVGRCPSFVESSRAPRLASASTSALLGRLRIETWPSMSVGPGRNAAIASSRRVVTALWPVFSSMGAEANRRRGR